ncbi:MAG TPA: O-antigen ligase family protein, partial [Acidimicrobiales bacterium]
MSATLTRPALVPAKAAALGPSLIRRTGDILTLLGTLLAPSYGKGIGGINGFPYADIVLGFAALARVAQALTEGLPRRGLRRQSVLLGLLGAFLVAGLVCGVVNNDPLPWAYLRVVIATIGTVLLVSVYGDGKDLRPVVTAFALGTAILALSSFGGLKLQGRAIGWSSHPNQLGHSCMMGIAAAAWLFEAATVRSRRWLWLGVIALDLVAVNRSGSRGALLGLALGGLAYLWLRGDRRLRIAAVAAVWAGTLLLVTGLVVLPPSNPLSRLLTSNGTDTSASLSDSARTDLLKSNWAEISAHPAFGDGFHGVDQIHMVYLQGWIGAGAVGGFFLMLVGGAMLVLPFAVRPRDLALACGGVAITIAWGFTNLLTLRDQWIYIAVLFAM